MEIKETSAREYYAIDILHVAKTLWRRAWLIALAGLLSAAIGFAIAAYAITPTYSSSVKLYVNNTSFSLGNTSFSITSSELTAAQGLVRTYGDILDSRSTLERIIEKAGVDYSYKELHDMLVYEPSNDTEIMRVTVTTEDPYESSKIANTIAEILPIRISEIIDGASMEVVDSAIPELEKVAPSITKYTAVGLVLGLFLSAIAVVISALLDDTIHDEDYVLNKYEYPILGKIPDLLNTGNKKYGYYYSQRNKKTTTNGDANNGNKKKN